MKKYVPLFIRSISRFRREKTALAQLEELDIASAGIDQDGDPYIKLHSGKIFFGHYPDPVQRRMYNHFISQRLKRSIPMDCINLGLDLIKRYLPHGSNEEAYSKNRFVDLKSGDVVIEGGAFIGLYSMLLSEQVGIDGRVISVEAIPENFRILQKNIVHNHIKNVVGINKAIFKEDRKISFFWNGKQLGSLASDVVVNGEELTIDAIKIDSLLKSLNIDTVTHVRLQLNGSEMDGLQGMKETLTCFPKLIVTGRYKKKGVLVNEKVEEFLLPLGYHSEYLGHSVYANKSEFS